MRKTEAGADIDPHKLVTVYAADPVMSDAARLDHQVFRDRIEDALAKEIRRAAGEELEELDPLGEAADAKEVSSDAAAAPRADAPPAEAARSPDEQKAQEILRNSIGTARGN